MEFASGIPEEVRNLLYDPQTSGGLLLSAAAGDATSLLAALRENGVAAQEIGEVVPKTKPLILIR